MKLAVQNRKTKNGIELAVHCQKKIHRQYNKNTLHMIQ